MTIEVDYVKETLQKKQAELARAIRAHSSQMGLSECENELIDRVQAMNRREEAVTMLNTLTRTLAQVHAGLAALQEGSYGICAECGDPISSRRLNAIPWASHCIQCQEDMDRHALMHMSARGWDEAA
jgi:DnaK suppressor protein